jgi:hypothetical protein
MNDMTTEKVHISRIRSGDTIFHNNKARTVCNSNIKRNECGISIFGDSYRAGTLPVLRVLL